MRPKSMVVTSKSLVMRPLPPAIAFAVCGNRGSAFPAGCYACRIVVPVYCNSVQ
ncbi:hypothetical protein PR003_g27593 [Phytophthora rubi]|uniref:Uncharacterized protein n=1 Tax=Phytophthora rubi TaxID=129364 RepID=A0A6A3I038_9STRA|nr:hypothetical protein PR002_g26536 [Phytophthora rubi]KAE8973418.1 hypothetical protein PR001_g26313 [Phytophthora rubi]KAE9281738.1 hypothetical protein PR003_g27593 [Phytophthora rubi]